MSPVAIIISLIICVLYLIAEWRIFSKAGQPGWAILIPIYNVWVLYKVVCGRGTAMFRLLIPFYNIYWGIKTYVKLANAYGKGVGFALGLIFLEPIFILILGLGGAQYVGPQNM